MRLATYGSLTLVLCSLVTFSAARADPVVGDFDQDSDRDLADFAQMANCFDAGNQPDPAACAAFDLQPSGIVDLADYRLVLCGFNGPGAAVDALTVVSPPSPSNAVYVNLGGTTAGAVQVQVTGGAQTVTVPTSNCGYMAIVQIQPNVVNHLFVTGIFGSGILSAPVPVTVVNDLSAPSLFIDFPADGAEVTTDHIDVAGRVSDALSGFVGLSVTVNDVPASVDIGVGTNGTFFAPAVPLFLGPNTLMATAIDGVGNTSTTFISVTRVEIPPDAAQLHIVSGNAQSMPVHFALPDPIIVQVTNMQNMAMPNKLVNFHVTRSDGRLAADAAPPLGEGTMMLQAFTDANGEAKAYWRLGSDAGSGNNRVEVTSTSVVGTTIFCASATHAAPTQINVGSGNNQRGEAGNPAPMPLDVWVNDTCNPVPGIDVTFTVTQGGGKVNGQDSITLATGANGHISVTLTLGPEQGNNIVTADFAGNPHAPARFNVFGVRRDPQQPTSLSGLVLDNAECAIGGATATLKFASGAVVSAVSNTSGQFAFDNLAAAGAARLRVNGQTATQVGMNMVPAGSFPSVPLDVEIVPNAANTLPNPMLLPRLNPNNIRSYSTTQDTHLTVEGIAGMEMIITAGSMTIEDAQGNLVPAPEGTPVSLNRVHHDDVPMPMPDGAAPPYAGTLQPSGAHFNPPVKIIYPNMTGLPAGSITNFMSFNHDSGRFEIVATGHITDDGQFSISDPGVGISIAGWHCNCPPYTQTGSCCSCSDCPEQADSCCVPECNPCEECQSGACVECGCCLFDGTCCSALGWPCIGSGCCPPDTALACLEANGQLHCCSGPGWVACCDNGCCTANCCNGLCPGVHQKCCAGPPEHLCDSDDQCCAGGCCVPPGQFCCPTAPGGPTCLPAGSPCP